MTIRFEFGEILIDLQIFKTKPGESLQHKDIMCHPNVVYKLLSQLVLLYMLLLLGKVYDVGGTRVLM